MTAGKYMLNTANNDNNNDHVLCARINSGRNMRPDNVPTRITIETTVEVENYVVIHWPEMCIRKFIRY